MGNIRICKVPDEYQLLICMAYQIWGARRNIFGSWEQGDGLIFEVENSAGSVEFAGFAIVGGTAFHHNPSLIWDDDEYPHRIPLTSFCYWPREVRAELTEEFKPIFVEYAGKNWGLYVQQQRPFPEVISRMIANRVSKYPNLYGIAMEHIGGLLSLEWQNRNLTGGKNFGDPHQNDIYENNALDIATVLKNPNPTCPKCGSANTRSLLYGHGLGIDSVTLGGIDLNPYCVSTGSCQIDFKWMCCSCDNKWGF